MSGGRGALRPTERFSGRADYYSQYRPRYPAEILKTIERQGVLRPGSVVTDIGSGTGLLTELFLRGGYVTYGVEPNREMRDIAESRLADHPNFRSVDGRAEETGLEEGSVDLIAIGQAFHWFELGPTRKEFRRILVPEGEVAIIWNDRVCEAKINRAYEDLLARFDLQGRQVRCQCTTELEIEHFYGHREFIKMSFHNEQRLDRSGLRGRFLSSSYAPLPGDPRHDRIVEDLDHLFAEHNDGGEVLMPYSTILYCGTLRS